jgi:hypothetical protein
MPASLPLAARLTISWTGSFGLPAMRRNNNNSGPLQNAAKIHASEVTELEGDLAYEKPKQSGRDAAQADCDRGLYEHSKGQNQQGLDTEQGAHRKSGN